MFFFLMIRRPPRSTLDRSSAASDVYKRQVYCRLVFVVIPSSDLITFLLIQVSVKSGEGQSSPRRIFFTMTLPSSNVIVKKIRRGELLSLIHISEPTRPY